MVIRPTRGTRNKRRRAFPFPKTGAARRAWKKDQFEKRRGQGRPRSAGMVRPRATKRKNWADSFRLLAAF
jgi:hypothetical protein